MFFSYIAIADKGISYWIRLKDSGEVEKCPGGICPSMESFDTREARASEMTLRVEPVLRGNVSWHCKPSWIHYLTGLLTTTEDVKLKEHRSHFMNTPANANTPASNARSTSNVSQRATSGYGEI